MRWLFIVAGVLAAFWLLGQLRVGAGMEYRREGFSLWVQVGAWKIHILPLRKKKRTPKIKKKSSAPRPLQPEPLTQRVGGALAYVQALLPVLLQAVGRIREKIRVDKLELQVTVGGEDPADTALRYGQANAVLGALWGTLNAAFDVRDGHASVRIDNVTQEPALYAAASLTLKLGQAVWMGLYFGFKALGTLLSVQNRKKQEQQLRKAA